MEIRKDPYFLEIKDKDITLCPRCNYLLNKEIKKGRCLINECGYCRYSDRPFVCMSSSWQQDFPDGFSDEFMESGVLGKLYFMCNREAIEKAGLGKYKGDTGVIPKFSLTADNCIKLTNFNALAGAFAAIAAFEIEDAGRYAVSPKTVVEQLKSDVKSAKAVEERGYICFLGHLFHGNKALKNLYIRICRAAIAKVK